MCKVLKYNGVVGFIEFLQSLGCSLEFSNTAVKIFVADAQLTTHIMCCLNVLQIVVAKHLQWIIFVFGFQPGFPRQNVMGMGVVWNGGQVVSQIVGNFLKLNVFLEVDQFPVFLDELCEFDKLLYIVFKGGKNVDVVPGDACHDCDVWSVYMKLGPQIDRGSEVFIAFKDRNTAVFRQSDHGLNSCDLCADHVGEIHLHFVQYKQNHGGDCGFSVAASDDDPGFGLGLLVQKLGIRKNADTQFFGAYQFGIVLPGMHA